MQAINLNSLLEGVADSGDSTALKQLLDFSLKKSTIVELIHRRRHETELVIKLLKTFATLLDFEEMKEDLLPICVQAIDEGLFAELPFKLSPVEVSTACATAGVDYEKIPEHLRSRSSYIEGIVTGDNLELFLSFESQISDLWHYMITCGRKCTKRMMTHYMSTENLSWFLRGAFLVQNTETVSFLRSYPEGLERAFFCSLILTPGGNTYWFAEECVREQLIVLSQDGWQTLKEKQLSLYNRLQNDV